MHCLEKYRSKQVREANRKLRVILESPDESAVHDFRVCIKRLTAFYRFLGQVDEKLSAKQLLKPYRGVFKSLGRIRDAHIAIGLIENLEPAPGARSSQLIGLLRSRIRRDYRGFRNLVGNQRAFSIRLPTIRATGISPVAITRHKTVYLEQLLAQILTPARRPTVDDWHGKRIQLKQYRHILEAFSLCPGRVVDQRLLKHISLVEQLLGDWHDRVISAEILGSLSVSGTNRETLINQMGRQAGQLLGSAKIYLPGLASQIAAD